MWVRTERTWRSSLRTTAATAGLLIAYVTLPTAGIWLYVTSFAPLSYFSGGGHGDASGYFSCTSPNGEFVNLDAWYGGWGRDGSRAAVVSVESGDGHWLTRFHHSFAWDSQRIWSPSGKRFVLEETGQFLWPLSSYFTHGWKDKYFVADARTGEQRSFDELCPGLPRLSSRTVPVVGWYDEDVFAFQNDRDIFFADIERHTVHQCKMPAASGQLGNPFFFPITQRGIFCDTDATSGGDLRILRYAPDIPQAELLLVRNAPAPPDRLYATSDGQWLLVNTFPVAGMHSNRWYLARLTDGAEASLLASRNADERGLIPSSWRVGRFVPGGHRILLHSETELGLFDADSHDLRTIPIEEARNGLTIDRAELSPAGGFALVYLARAQMGMNFGEPGYVAVDLKRGTVGPFFNPGAGIRSPRWLGEDRLLFDRYDKTWKPFVINRDGTGIRPLLAQ